MDRAQISALLEEAVDQLIREHSSLLDFDVTERSLSHHLAFHIARLVPPGYDVDVEYNRHGGDPKRLNLPHREALDSELRATTVFPDIVVHKRNKDSDNLLVIEVKKPGEDMAYDEMKLRAFRGELFYEHAAHVVIGRERGEIVRNIVWIGD